MSVTKLNVNNKIINGAFDFWQRGASFVSPTSGTYVADRFAYGKTGTMVHTVTKDSDVPATSFGQSSLSESVTTAQAVLAANDQHNIFQRIEGNVLRSLKDKKMVLSFWVKSSVIGTYSVFFGNSAATRGIVKEYSISSANTWEKKTIRLQHDSTGAWNYDSSSGLLLNFMLAAGTTRVISPDVWTNLVATQVYASTSQVNAVATIGNVFKLTDVCLIEDNEGQTRQPSFVYAGRDYFEELQLCQRYYEKSYDLLDAPATATLVGEYHMWCATVVSTRAFFNFLVQKRTGPAMSFWNRNGTASQWFDTGSATARSVDSFGALSSGQGFYISVTPSAINRVQVGHWVADAEI